MIIRTEEEISHWSQVILDATNKLEELGELTDADMIMALACAIYSIGHRAGQAGEEEE